MRPPGTTDSENDPVYRAGLLLAQLWGMLDDVLKGKVPKKQIVANLNTVQRGLKMVIELLKEAD